MLSEMLWFQCLYFVWKSLFELFWVIVELKILNWAKDSYYEIWRYLEAHLLLNALNLAIESLKTRFLDTESYDDSKIRCTGYNLSPNRLWAIKSFFATFIALNGLFVLNLYGKLKETFYNCFFRWKLVFIVSFAFKGGSNPSYRHCFNRSLILRRDENGITNVCTEWFKCTI